MEKTLAYIVTFWPLFVAAVLFSAWVARKLWVTATGVASLHFRLDSHDEKLADHKTDIVLIRAGLSDHGERLSRMEGLRFRPRTQDGAG